MLNGNWSAAYYQNDTYSSNHTSTVSSQTYPTTWATVNAIIHIFALLTNLGFVVVVVADKSNLAGPRLLILNLAVCGLVLSAGWFPATSIVSYLSRERVPSSCSFFAGTVFFVTATNWADVPIAINRIVAICYPHYYRRPYGHCLIQPLNPYGRIFGFIPSVIPFCIVGILSALLFLVARQRTRALSPESVSGKRLIKRRLNVAQAMLASLLWHVITSFPIIFFTMTFPQVISQQPWLSAWIRGSTLLEFGVSPVTLILGSMYFKVPI
ncbi:hypothetical protein RvY_14252 [Ramazzottius varieornatus]|uniref:G-protein coupled receptors family 1 profile domain-containing protein n=1 Tax=Ramazzottius varieornatus TaxID=947166 RepID=A0A1D1VUK2_RAMVA|nr:hypothetical protein RvY_14252 [Ramazzottius varieornatus]